jgi:hypothetical protein
VPWAPTDPAGISPPPATLQQLALNVATTQPLSKAASLPLRLMQASRQKSAARQDVASTHRSSGQAVIDQGVPLADDAAVKLRQDGTAIIEQIAGVDEKVAWMQYQLDRAEAKSDAAKQYQTAIAGQREQRNLLLSRLRECQYLLGKTAQNDPNVGELLPELRDRLTKAKGQLDAATAHYEAVQKERRETSSRLRSTDLKAAGVVFTVCGLIVGRIVFKIVKDEWQKPGTSHQVTERVPTTQPHNDNVMRPLVEANTLPPRVEPGLTLSQLKLASAVVVTTYKACPNIEQIYSGSAATLSLTADGTLHLITNRHVLALDELMASKNGNKLWVGEYAVWVKFPSGQACSVLKIQPETTGVDLALLQVDGRNLRAGVDYVFMTEVSDLPTIEPGDAVVAIGTPLGESILENTQTFGHVSGIRKVVDGQITTNYLQIDAAINQGNSGGPLFLKVGDRHLWAGINTLGGSPQQGVQGLNFAIDSRQAMSLRYYNYDANAAGVAALLSQVHNFPAGTYKP